MIALDPQISRQTSLPFLARIHVQRTHLHHPCPTMKSAHQKHHRGERILLVPEGHHDLHLYLLRALQEHLCPHHL
jgi:hypothetical protein